jgi:hypothetical protein
MSVMHWFAYFKGWGCDEAGGQVLSKSNTELDTVTLLWHNDFWPKSTMLPATVHPVISSEMLQPEIQLHNNWVEKEVVN